MLRRPLFWQLMLTLALVAVTGWCANRQEARLGHGTFVSGSVLLGCLVFLTAFHWRKKITFLPVGNASFWMRAHLAVGWATCGLCAVHVQFRWPQGRLELILFGLFVATFVSGLFGWYLTRQLPKRLSKVRDEVIFERIPHFRAIVCQQAQEIMRDLLGESPAMALADFYTSTLTPYFVRHRGWYYYVRPTNRTRNHILNRLRDLERFFTGSEKEAAEKLARLVDRRDDLDFHAALQGQLKLWLFAHISLTYALMLLATLHALMACAFVGS